MTEEVLQDAEDAINTNLEAGSSERVNSLGNSVLVVWFPPSVLNVNVKKFYQARVIGGSNYDSLKVALCLDI